MAKYKIVWHEDEQLLEVGFGDETAESPEILKEADELAENLISSKVLKGGQLIKISGAATIGIAGMLGKKLAALYGAVAFFDPKLGQNGAFYIAISNHPNYKVGQRL